MTGLLRLECRISICRAKALPVRRTTASKMPFSGSDSTFGRGKRDFGSRFGHLRTYGEIAAVVAFLASDDASVVAAPRASAGGCRRLDRLNALSVRPGFLPIC